MRVVIRKPVMGEFRPAERVTRSPMNPENAA
jgi:hypothetical protein